MATMDLSLMNCEKAAPLSCCTLALGLKLMLKKKKKLLLEDLLEKKKKKTGVEGAHYSQVITALLVLLLNHCDALLALL